MTEKELTVQTEEFELQFDYEEELDKAIAYWYPKLFSSARVDKKSEDHELLKRVLDAIFKTRPQEYREVTLVTSVDLTLNLNALHKKLEDKKLPPTAQAKLNNLLTRTFLIGKDTLNWRSSASPTVTHAMPRITPFIKERELFNLHHINHFHAILNTYLPDIHNMPPQHQAWLLVLSAIFHSKLFNKKALSAFVNSLFRANPKLITLPDGLVMLEIELDRHCILSPHTLAAYALLVRHKQTEFMRYSALKPTHLQALLKIEKPDLFEKIPKQLNQIIEIAQSGAYMYTPSFLLAHNMGKLESTPLFLETQYRLLTQKRVNRTLKNQESELKENAIKISANNKTCRVDHLSQIKDTKDLKFQHNTIKTLLKTAKESSRSEALSLITKMIEQPPKGLSLLAWWLINWLKHLVERAPKTTGDQSLSWSSITRYLSPVSSSMLANFDNLDIESLYEEDWLELLQQTIDESKDKLIGKLLISFVRFCENNHNLMPLPLYELSGIDFNAQVNANVVSPFESIKIFETLVPDPETPSPHQRASLALFTLGQFCGLRRQEALMLKTDNLYGTDGHWQLFVRPHRVRQLKSTDSRRKLALCQLVPPLFLKWLIDWLKYQRLQESPYLFGMKSHQGATLPDPKDLPEAVIQAVRQATGDQSLVFHNLRHSFASFNFLKMMLPAQPELAPWLGFPQKPSRKATPLHKKRLAELKKFYSPEMGKSFLHYYAPKEHPLLPRSTLFILSDLLGHKAPNTSFKSYIHFTHLVDMGYLKQDIELIKHQLSQLYDPSISASSASQLNKRLLTGSDFELVIRIHRWLGGQSELRQKVKQISFKPEPPLVGRKHKENTHGLKRKSNHVDTSLLKVLPFILLMLEQGRCAEEITDTLRVPADSLDLVIRNHTHLCAIQTTKNKPRFQPFPKLMRGKTHQSKLKRMIESLQTKTVSTKAICSALELFLNGADQKGGYQVRLKSEDELVDFVRLYNLIGVPASSISLIIYPSIRNNNPEVYDALLNSWLKKIQTITNHKPAKNQLIVRAPIDVQAPFHAELVSMNFKATPIHRRYEVNFLILYLALIV